VFEFRGLSPGAYEVSVELPGPLHEKCSLPKGVRVIELSEGRRVVGDGDFGAVPANAPGQNGRAAGCVREAANPGSVTPQGPVSSPSTDRKGISGAGPVAEPPKAAWSARWVHLLLAGAAVLPWLSSWWRPRQAAKRVRRRRLRGG
jgi:hypothetical protein